MEKIKLIVADLDGTLLDDNGELDTEIIDIAKKLKEKGVIFTLASGRRRSIMDDFVNRIGVDAPYLSDNGANIWKGKECLKSYNINPEYYNDILRILDEEKLPYNAYGLDYVTVYLKAPRLDLFRGRLAKYDSLVEYDPNKDYSNEIIPKITLDSQFHKDIDSAVERVVKLCPDVDMKISEFTLYSITAKGVDKGRACLELADYLSIKPEEIMTIGDNSNDVSMFKVAGESLCVSNAADEVKEYASHVCASNNEHGPARFLKEYFNL